MVLSPDPRLVDRLRAAGCVFAEDEARLLRGGAHGAALEELVARRVAGEPLEHLLGRVSFLGLELAVGPGVFVPRRRTELMARLAVSLARAGAVVVELCCGVAPVASAVLASRPDVEVCACDLDPVAVRYARRNIGDRAVVGDLDSALPVRLERHVDVLAVNTPYVPTTAIAAMPPEARDHEPRAALDGGGDGLDVQRRLAELAPRWLAPGGTVLVEVAAAQVETSTRLFAAAGLTPRVERDEDLDATVVLSRSGRRPR